MNWAAFFLSAILLLFVLLLLKLIANTASRFFSPTLQHFADVTNCPDHLAGVTLLALGNGAPDVFTMIASRSSKFLVGINTLIGGVLIVSTVVVGAVTLNVTHPVHLNKLDFLRDMGFLLVMLTVVLVAVVWNPSALIISAVLLVCYVGYIVLVFHRGDSAQLHYEALEHEALEHPHNVLFDQYSDVDDAASTSAQCGDRCYQRVDRLYALVELPVRVLQHSTIPLLESTADNLSIWQYYRWAYPIAVPGLLGLWLSTSDYGSTVEMYLTLALCVLVSIILALSLYILPAPIVPIVRTAPDKWGDFPGNEHYHSSRMYLQRTSLYIWLFVAFCSCIMWIDLTANALVAALSLLGDTIGIPKEFLGLTVLAWGNSVGDCITNTALARQGRGLMALSGCYGGPLFNVLVGLGVSLLLNALSGEPVVFAEESRGGIASFLHADYAVQSLLLSILCMYVVLIVGVSLVHCAEYRLTSSTGACLIAVYVLYSLCQCALLYRDEYQ